jgi:type VI protein secretion system component Hcp
MKLKNSTLILAMLFLMAAWSCRAFDTYLHIAGIPGESLITGHTNDTAINSFSFGMSHQGSGKPEFSLAIEKNVSPMSPVLAFDCASGITNATASISCFKTGAASTDPAFYSITVTNVQITSVSVSGGTGDTAISEEISLQFTGIQWTYIPQNNSGVYGTPIVTSFGN